jgi:hypothetical protein
MIFAPAATMRADITQPFSIETSGSAITASGNSGQMNNASDGKL